MKFYNKGRKLKGFLIPNDNNKIEDEIKIVKDAMHSPIGSKKLSSLTSRAQNVLIITSDHTRPVPSKIIIPAMLEEIKKGNEKAKVRIIVATGCHRAMTQNELTEKFGEEILKQVTIIMHNAQKTEKMVYMGLLPSKGQLWLNRQTEWADLIIAEGFIEPHFFAGFSGGRKSILPGIASRKTVYSNHCAEFIANSKATTGMLEGNPIHEDMIYAAKKAKLQYIVNVVLNKNKKIIAAFTGNVIKAHEEGCEYLKKHCSVNRIESEFLRELIGKDRVIAVSCDFLQGWV